MKEILEFEVELIEVRVVELLVELVEREESFEVVCNDLECV